MVVADTRPNASDQHGGEATLREIRQQPAVWRIAAHHAAERHTAFTDFLAPLLARPELRIILTGAGTSAFVGGIAAPVLARQLRRPIEAIATTDLVSNPREFFAQDVPTLLVSFARSGKSPESNAATDLADEVLTEVHHLVLTCDEAGDLYRKHTGRLNSHVVLMPTDANDAGFAMTSSFTSMLLSSLLILGSSAPALVDLIAKSADHVLNSWVTALEELASRDIGRVVYLGSGPLAALARESALKTLELTAGKVVAYHDSSLGFRHGPKSVLTEGTIVFVYVSADPYTRQYDVDILNELRRTMPPHNVIAIAAAAFPGAPSEENWILPDTEDLEDGFLAAVYVIVAQIFAVTTSLSLGMRADNPFPDGAVNRVVQGVRIHPLDRLPA